MTIPELAYRLRFIQEQLNYWELQLCLVGGALTKEEALRRIDRATKSLRDAQRHLALVATLENHAAVMRASLHLVHEEKGVGVGADFIGGKEWKKEP